VQGRKGEEREEKAGERRREGEGKGVEGTPCVSLNFL